MDEAMMYLSPDRGDEEGSPALSFYVNVDHLLYGEELEDIGRSSILVESGVIAEISSGWRVDARFNGGVAIPLPVNTHVHLSDYRVLDNYYGYSLGEYVGRKGLKHALIKLYREPIIADELVNTLLQYSFIVDYQENYEDCPRYRRELGKYGIGYIGLSRPREWSEEELGIVLKKCCGIGVSNPTIVPPWLLPMLAHISEKYTVSAHVSETQWMKRTGGLHYLLEHGVKLKHVVHGVFLEDWEIKRLGDEGVSLVVTPRSNLWFVGKLPPINKALKHGVNVAVGSDNAGCFHPDIWLDLYTIHLLKKIEPLEALKMALINGYSAIGFKPFVIEEGRPAYFMVVDLGLANTRSGNIYLSLLNRVVWSRRKIIVKKSKTYIIESKRGIV